MAKKNRKPAGREDKRRTSSGQGHSLQHKEELIQRRKRRKRHKIAVIVIEIIIVVILLAGLFLWQKLNQINRTKIDDKSVGINEDLDTGKVSGYTNFAIFGLDNRSNGDLDSGLSDVIMVCSINNDTGEIRILSVYRDTYLATGDISSDASYEKANYAFSTGGAKKALSMLNKNLDLNLTDYVTVDFYAVTEAIDDVGGIELNITSDEMDYINGYIDSVSEVTGKKSNYITQTGEQLCDGVQATAYCRIRYTSGGDFTRAQRQRTVLSQLFKKVKSSDASTLNSLIDDMLPNIETSFSNKEILSLATNAMKYKLADTAGFPFKLTTETIGSKGSVDVPCTLESNVEEMYSWLFGEDDYEPSSTVKKISDYIERTTGDTEEDAVDYGISADNLSEESSIDSSTDSSNSTDSTDSASSSTEGSGSTSSTGGSAGSGGSAGI